MTIIKEWAITAALQRTVQIPVDDDETKADVETWLKSVIGQKYLLLALMKSPHTTGYNKNANLIIEEIILQETEVKSTDTCLRV